MWARASLKCGKLATKYRWINGYFFNNVILHLTDYYSDADRYRRGMDLYRATSVAFVSLCLCVLVYVCPVFKRKTA